MKTTIVTAHPGQKNPPFALTPDETGGISNEDALQQLAKLRIE